MTTRKTPSKKPVGSVPEKKPKKKGLIRHLKGFLHALGDRYHHVIQVIDDALASENLKDRIWAVEQIMKRTPSEKIEPEPAEVPGTFFTPQDLQEMTNAELLQKIHEYLRDPHVTRN